MSQETLNTVLAGMAAFAGVIAVFLSIWHDRQRKREREEDRRLVVEQLELARVQDEMRPDLQVDDVRLLDPDDSDALEGSVDPPWIARLRNIMEVGPLSAVSAFLRQRRLYDGLAAQKVVVVTLANRGKLAAHLVTGWVRLDAAHLEPLKPSGGTSVSLEDGEYSIAVVGDEIVTLAPRRSLSFRVIVAVLSPGTSPGITRIRYDFSSSEGHGPEGSRDVPV